MLIEGSFKELSRNIALEKFPGIFRDHPSKGSKNFLREAFGKSVYKHSGQNKKTKHSN